MKRLPRNQIITGDAARVLPTLLGESVDAVITSPPYYRLRQYAAGAAELGHEPTVEAYVEHIRAVMRAVARVLKPTGSLWVNLSDTYARHPRFGAPRKSLLLAPERIARALMADGWILRNKVVWAKPNPLPSSVGDRLSPTWEVIYFFTRRDSYYFDLDAIREGHRSASRSIKPRPTEAGRLYLGGNDGLGMLKAAGRVGHPNGRNPGDVWTVSPSNFRGEHFATFPPALIERPLLATVPERICVQCDAAWKRPARIVTVQTADGVAHRREVGELARCNCFAPTRPGVVLDPFFGSGTVGMVAARHGRDWLGVELNPSYVNLARQRLGGRLDGERKGVPFCLPHIHPLPHKEVGS